MTSTVDTLDRDFGGRIIEPGSDEYDSARRTLLATGAPLSVLRPASVADVQTAVRHVVREGLPLSVRGGGHSFTGFGTIDGGVVIDLRELAAVEVVDEAHHIVRVGGGATWGQVAAALAPYGLAISSGDTKSVGVGGLTLSGGIGWKVRKYGLALDNLLAVDVVLAGGDLERASADEHPDLYWAVRGGGGNVGIVTAFDFQAHETTDLHFGTVSFPAAEARAVLAGWADYQRSAAAELTSTVLLANPFTGGADAPVEIHIAYDGDDAAAADAVLEPIRRLGSVVSDTVALMPYADTLEDGMVPPPGIAVMTRNAFVDEPSVPGALGVLADVAASGRSPIIAIRSVGGAVARVPEQATAYAHRQAELMVITTVIGPTAVVDAAGPGLAAVWERLTPYTSGAYANFLATATEADVAAIYPAATYERLATVKGRYDPANVFARNHNVRPA